MSVLAPLEPPLWKALARCWLGLDDRACWLWWAALQKSRWSHAQAFREALASCDGLANALDAYAVDQFLDQHARPAHLVALLEALHQERLLSRRESSRLECQVLTHVDARGEWIPRERTLV